MVAVICSPTKYKFRQISGSYHKSVIPVCNIHQNLCSLSCLRILICDILHIYIMLNINKMPLYRLYNRNLFKTCTQALCKFTGIIICPVRSSKARHSHSFYSALIKSQHIKCLYTNQKRQRRVKTSRNTQYHFFYTCVNQSLLQSECLYCKYFLTSFTPLCRIVRYKRLRVKDSFKFKFFYIKLKLRLKIPLIITGLKSSLLSSLQIQPVDIYLNSHSLIFESVAFRQYLTVFSNNVLTSEYKILCGLTLTCIGIDIAAYKFL